MRVMRVCVTRPYWYEPKHAKVNKQKIGVSSSVFKYNITFHLVHIADDCQRGSCDSRMERYSRTSCLDCVETSRGRCLAVSSVVLIYPAGPRWRGGRGEWLKAGALPGRRFRSSTAGAMALKGLSGKTRLKPAF